MTRNDIVRALNEEYDRLRAENLRERDRRIGEVIAKDPSMEALIYGGRDLFQKQARLLLSHPEQAEKNARETRLLAAENDRQLRKRLKELGYAENYLDPIYRCPVCKDRGWVGDGVREMCACFKQRLTRRLYEESAAGTGAAQSFEAFDETIFPDDEKVSGSRTQRQLIRRARTICEEYADSYPDTDHLGIIMMGESGLGKTYLLNCILNRLIARGFAPIKVTGYRLYEAMRGAHFGDAEKRAEFDQLIGCEALFIDDLGSEPVVQNVTREYLFSLLNERLIQGRHTVIATNLKPDNLLSVYGERVFSRLIDGMNVTVITLGGRDLRALARLRK